MNIEEAREYCLSVRGVSESMPFGDNVLVCKIMGKIIALIALEPMSEGFAISLKCEPERAIQLREAFSGIIAGYHLNKKHWNSIYLDSDVPNELIKELILHSAEEVVKKLPKKKQEEYSTFF